MFPATWFIVLIFSLASSVTGNILRATRSSITFPVAKRVNLTTIRHLVRQDQSRAKLLKAQGIAKASSSLLVHNDAVVNSQAENQAVSYVASVGIGIPATTYSLIVDTGSPFILIDTTNKPYVKTGTSVAEANTISITTGSSSFTGKEFLDTVTITSTLVVPHQAICVSSSSDGFEGIDGFLGLGPTDLSLGTLSPAITTTVPNIVDNAFSQGLIPADEISIAFEPTTSATSLNGVLTWGGTNSNDFTGKISFSPITTVSPSSEFWGINQSLHYGTKTILAQTAGIVDTGTTLILIATNAFTAYKSATGGVLDAATGLLKLTSTQFSALKSLIFQTSTPTGTFELTPNAQLWPRSLNTLIGGTAGTIYLIVGDIGTDSGSGLDFINGQTFLERFYLVLDTTNKRVGIANTTFTHATTN